MLNNNTISGSVRHNLSRQAQAHGQLEEPAHPDADSADRIPSHLRRAADEVVGLLKGEYSRRPPFLPLQEWQQWLLEARQ